MIRKAAAIVLIASLGLVFQAASCGGSVRDSAGKVIVAAETALHIATDAELALRCGQPTAPAAPLCITPEKHAIYKQKLLDGFKLVADAQGIYNLLPPTGSPDISAITQIIVKIGEIIQEVMAGFPQADAQKLAAQASVASTLKVGK